MMADIAYQSKKNEILQLSYEINILESNEKNEYVFVIARSLIHPTQSQVIKEIAF